MASLKRRRRKRKSKMRKRRKTKRRHRRKRRRTRRKKGGGICARGAPCETCSCEVGPLRQHAKNVCEKGNDMFHPCLYLRRAIAIVLV